MLCELRHFERKPYEKAINCSVNILDFKELTRLNLTANTVNISEGGICIRTNYPFENGHVLKFHTDIGRNAGIVRWGKPDDNGIFKAGIKFI